MTHETFVELVQPLLNAAPTIIGAIATCRDVAPVWARGEHILQEARLAWKQSSKWG